jgi:exopolyphosphatase/guanosine-5'-triphosphate,3'-diphosphate pyrophosphatase
LEPPLGWSAQDLTLAAVVARYHRRALPQARHKAFARLPADERETATHLAAMLRLAYSFDCGRDGSIRKIAVRVQDGFLVVDAQGYSARSTMAEKIAAARHLLELVYHRPVLVRAQRPSRK